MRTSSAKSLAPLLAIVAALAVATSATLWWAVHQAHLSAPQAGPANERMNLGFMVLGTAFCGLLAGTALLIRHLLREVQGTDALWRQLTQANRELEARVSERTRKVEEGRALLHFILDTGPSEVVLADVESGRVHFMNHRLIERLGLKAAPATLFLPQLLHDAGAGRRLMQALDEYGQVDDMQALVGNVEPHWRALSARLIEVDGKLAHLLWSFDIDTHKALETQLREQATHDALTGLLNRRAFLERSTALFDHCRRHAQACAALMIDIDHFKRINDTHGHQTGDAVIHACGQAIGQPLRDADLLGRLGGEEFAVLLPHATLQQALGIAERIRTAVAQPGLPSHPAMTLAFTLSIGATALAPHHTGIDALLAEADAALYDAKAAGRNTVRAYAPHADLLRDTNPASP